MIWQTSRRKLSLDCPLVMAILNVTPDSFSDGGEFVTLKSALKQAEKFISEGADIIDIGGESTRPNSERVSTDDEINRVVPVIEAITTRFDIPISIDTTKSTVAEASINAGAEIINDISGLRFDERIAEVAAKHHTGLILMHSRGTFETMHRQEPVEDILHEVAAVFRSSIEKAKITGVDPANIALDIGIGFSKTFEQNLELLAKLDKLVSEFSQFPILAGTSRKSFIGKILGGVPADERLTGSLASVVIAIWNGAKIVRVHDVKETVETIKLITAVKSIRNES
ncbi:MAG: dihydropteroate synthase [Saprospiraceae bacterium]|nr:dihydropteroate synthase [Pyrinomonadaceae bacterium]